MPGEMLFGFLICFGSGFETYAVSLKNAALISVGFTATWNRDDEAAVSLLTNFEECSRVETENILPS